MIVVTGATGNIGRPLVQGLASAGERVRAVARNTPDGEPPAGVEHRSADLAVQESLTPVFEGADALFLLLPGELLGGGEPAALLDAAKAGGIRRVVALSSQAAGTRPEAASHAGFGVLEEAVRQSGLDWTILRPGGFFTNAYAFVESVRGQREVFAPFGDVGLPVVDPADIAEIAAAALRDDAHNERIYVLTGPELVTPRQQARAIGEALGTAVRFTELTREQARENMLNFMPEPVVDGTLDILGEPVADERLVSPDVERVLGRAPRTFEDWAARNSAVFT